MKYNYVFITYLGIVFFTMLLLGCSQAAAEPAPIATIEPTPTAALPQRILFIGDSFTSFNLGLDKHMNEMAASANPANTIETASVVGDGYTLYYQWKFGQALKKIQEGNWDVVVLQEDIAMWDYDQQAFFEYARMFDEEIKKAGAQTVLFMHHMYKRPQNPMTTEEIAQDYNTLGTELGSKVAPVGLAWQKAIQERPDMNLYADGLHPNIQGTYLTTCVFYATIFGESPVGLSYYPADMIAGIDTHKVRWDEWQKMTEDEMSFLQEVAWETVVDYEAQNK